MWPWDKSQIKFLYFGTQRLASGIRYFWLKFIIDFFCNRRNVRLVPFWKEFSYNRNRLKSRLFVTCQVENYRSSRTQDKPIDVDYNISSSKSKFSVYYAWVLRLTFSFLSQPSSALVSTLPNRHFPASSSSWVFLAFFCVVVWHGHGHTTAVSCPL